MLLLNGIIGNMVAKKVIVTVVHIGCGVNFYFGMKTGLPVEGFGNQPGNILAKPDRLLVQVFRGVGDNVLNHGKAAIKLQDHLLK